jgi:hypothetical protein
MCLRRGSSGKIEKYPAVPLSVRQGVFSARILFSDVRFYVPLMLPVQNHLSAYLKQACRCNRQQYKSAKCAG